MKRRGERGGGSWGGVSESERAGEAFHATTAEEKESTHDFYSVEMVISAVLLVKTGMPCGYCSSMKETKTHCSNTPITQV